MQKDLVPFRERPEPIEVNFIIVEGGIGDYVCYMSGIEHVAKVYPHVRGYLWVPQYFKEIADLIMKPYKLWAVNTRDKLSRSILESRPLRAPRLEPINAMGAHLVDLGHIYYAEALPEPGTCFYPQFKGEGYQPVDEEFVVLTPGATDKNRAMPAHTFNSIKNFVLDKGYTPVFLGAMNVGTRNILYDESYDFTGGIDLRGKTGLILALKIMKNARAVIGIDNGLLHLAAMTETPIVFGYTIAAPWHRRPRRKVGEIYDIYPKVEKLKCSFCQSRFGFVAQNFKECRYGDNKCTLEISDPSLWLTEIAKII